MSATNSTTVAVLSALVLIALGVPSPVLAPSCVLLLPLTAWAACYWLGRPPFIPLAKVATVAWALVMGATVAVVLRSPSLLLDVLGAR